MESPHSGLTGGCFGKKLEFQLSLPLDSLDPYWSGKHEIELFLGLLVSFWGVSKCRFSILQCKNDPLHKIIKSNREYRVAPFWGLKSQNIDHIPLPGDAVYCGNFNFHSYDTKKITNLS